MAESIRRLYDPDGPENVLRRASEAVHRIEALADAIATQAREPSDG
jgi:hypothetical protein